MIRRKGNMKKKHILLFLMACVFLYISQLFAASLIALGLLYQMNLLFENLPITKASQIAAFKFFLIAIPQFFFFGGIHAFVTLYWNEKQWLFFIFALVTAYSLSFLVFFFFFLVFRYLEQNDFNTSATYQAAFMQIKNEKKGMFVKSLFLLLLSFIPPLPADWKIIFSLMVLQLYFHRSQMKRVFGL